MPLPTRTEAEYCDLLKDIKRGKTKHFEAARRKHQAHFGLGITAFLLSSSAATLTTIGGDNANKASVLAAAFASVFVGLITFLRLEKTVEGQRTVANSYLSMYREGKALLALARDGVVDEATFLEAFEQLRADYDALNRVAEPFTVGRGAFEAALEGDEDLGDALVVQAAERRRRAAEKKTKEKAAAERMEPGASDTTPVSDKDAGTPPDPTPTIEPPSADQGATT